jgi:hypothetical protein
MSLGHNPSIVTDGLVYMLDPGNKKCWDGTSTTIYSLVNGAANGLLRGPFGFDTTSYNAPVMAMNNGSLTTATSTASISLVTPDLNQLALNNSITIMFAAKKNFYGLGGNQNGNTEFMQGVSNGYGNGWRISEGSQSPIQPVPGQVAFTGQHYWGFEFTDLTGPVVSVADAGSTTNRMCICATSLSPTTLLGFVNGTTAQTVNTRGYVTGASQPYISFTSAGAGSFNGLFGFLMIYNRTLSLDEINQNYNALRGRYNL